MKKQFAINALILFLARKIKNSNSKMKSIHKSDLVARIFQKCLLSLLRFQYAVLSRLAHPRLLLPTLNALDYFFLNFYPFIYCSSNAPNGSDGLVFEKSERIFHEE